MSEFMKGFFQATEGLAVPIIILVVLIIIHWII